MHHMPVWRLLSALCLLAALVLGHARSPYAASSIFPGEDLALEQRKQYAVTSLKEARYAEAYETFMRLLRDDPEDDDVNMGIALAAQGLKKYPHAVMAYERLLNKYPRDASLRIQLARVYVALGEPESARLELEKAKTYDTGITDEEVADVLASLVAGGSRWQHQGRVSFGVMYDTNSNQGPRSDYMTLGIFENLYVEGVKEKASWGNYLSASLEVGYRLSDDGPWWLMGDVVGYQRWNTSGGVTNNNGFTYGRGAFGIRRIGEKTFADLRIKADIANQHHKQAEDQTISSFGPELTLGFTVHPRMQLITRASYEKRAYDVSTMRDGFYWSAGEFVRFFIGERRHEMLFGVTLTGNDPDERAYKYLGVEPSVRLVFKLPYDISVSPYASFREENYKQPATGLETTDRRDKQWRAGGMIAWDICKDLTLDVNYQFIHNDSSSELYTYKQNIISTGLTYKF